MESRRRQFRSRFLSAEKPTAETMKATAQKDFGDKAGRVPELYPPTLKTTCSVRRRTSPAISSSRFSTWAWIESQSKTGKQPIYRYRFDLAPSGIRSERTETGRLPLRRNRICFWTTRFEARDDLARSDRQLSEVMQKYWTNFAKTAIPTVRDCPNGRSTPQPMVAGDVPRRQTRRPQRRAARSLFVPVEGVGEVDQLEKVKNAENRRCRREAESIAGVEVPAAPMMSAAADAHVSAALLLPCELATMPAVQEINRQPDRQPGKEAQPGQNRQSGHQQHAEEHAQHRSRNARPGRGIRDAVPGSR